MIAVPTRIPSIVTHITNSLYPHPPSSILLLSVPSLFIYLFSPLLPSLLCSIHSFIFTYPTFILFLFFPQICITPSPSLPSYPPSALCPMHSTGQPACFCHLMTRTCWGHSHGVQHLEDVLIERKNNAPQVQ